MKFDLVSFSMVLFVFLATLWLASAGGRLNGSWKVASGRAGGLKEKLAGYARLMASNMRQTERINEEIKELRGEIDAAQKTVAARQGELTRIKPPPPPEIEVQSEFPPSDQARAWVAVFKRNPNARGTGEAKKRLLVWAPEYNAALHRAEGMLSRQEYQVTQIQKLD